MRSYALKFSPQLALLASVAMHVLLVLYFQHVGAPSRPVIYYEPVNDTPISVELFEKRDKRPTQIVNTDDAGNRAEDPDAKYLGEHNQTAESPTVGRPGDGMNAARTNPIDVPNADPDEFGPAKPKDWHALTLRDLGVGGQAVTDAIKNAKVGDRTILSTREYKYYGYYERIRQLAVDQYWRPFLQTAMMKAYRRNHIPNVEEVTTHVRLLLDKAGNIQRITVQKPCGVKEFDEAAVNALEKGGPFPNPPRGLLDDDDFVRIDWAFQVQLVDPGFRVEFERGFDDPASGLR